MTKRNVIICDDDQEKYEDIKRYLADYEKEYEYECSERVCSEKKMTLLLEKADQDKKYYDFILIDQDLSKIQPGYTGFYLYNTIKAKFPNETYIIYTMQDTARFRDQINLMMFEENVHFILMERVLKRENLGFYLSRIVQKTPRNKVFIVQGRNESKNAKLANFIKNGLKLDIVDWETARLNAVDNSIWSIVKNGINQSWATIVFFTDDETVQLKETLAKKETEKRIAEQSRPNVFIEAGYSFGKRPQRTIFMYWHDSDERIREASDFSGNFNIYYDEGQKWRHVIKNSLEKARCKLNPSRNWKTMKL